MVFLCFLYLRKHTYLSAAVNCFVIITLLHDRQFHLPNNIDNDTTHAVYGGLNNLVRKRQVELSACQAVQ